MSEPILDDCHIRHAIMTAQRSPCRSKRGVVLFDPATGAHRGSGFNGPPPTGADCPGRAVCAGTCGQRSIHAEMRALRDAAVYLRYHPAGPYDLVHVELSRDPPVFDVARAADGSPLGGAPHVVANGIVACDGPSCLPCAVHILDVGFVAGVWLFEAMVSSGDSHVAGLWRRYTPTKFHRATLERCGMVAA